MSRKRLRQPVDQRRVFDKIGLADEAVHFDAREGHPEGAAELRGARVGRLGPHHADRQPERVLGQPGRRGGPACQPAPFVAAESDVIGVGGDGSLPQTPGIGLESMQEKDARGVGHDTVERRAVRVRKPQVADVEEGDRRSA